MLCACTLVCCLLLICNVVFAVTALPQALLALCMITPLCLAQVTCLRKRVSSRVHSRTVPNLPSCRVTRQLSSEYAVSPAKRRTESDSLPERKR